MRTEKTRLVRYISVVYLTGSGTISFYGERLQIFEAHREQIVSSRQQALIQIYNTQINARALIGQLVMVYCAGKTMECLLCYRLTHSASE